MSVVLPCDRSLLFNAPVKNPFLTAAEMDSRLKAPGCVANAVMCWTVAGPAAENRRQIHETVTALGHAGSLDRKHTPSIIAPGTSASQRCRQASTAMNTVPPCMTVNSMRLIHDSFTHVASTPDHPGHGISKRGASCETFRRRRSPARDREKAKEPAGARTFHTRDINAVHTQEAILCAALQPMAG